MNKRLTFLWSLAAIAYIHPAWAILDCNNLLAVRLAVVGQPYYGDVLSDCGTTTFRSSPSIAAFDCVGETANGCAERFRSNTPEQYMKGGWSANNELWYLPLDDDVEGGNLCLDGTRQLIHVDKAVTWSCSRRGTRCTTDADCPGKKNLCQMSDIESDKWVFYTQGGIDCLNADDCLQKYFTEKSLNTTINAPFGRDGRGVLSADPRNPFHRFNRVRLHKCTMDGFRGNITRPADTSEPRPSADLGGDTHEFDLHFHGYRHWLAAFNKLQNAQTDHAEYYGSCDNDADCDADDQCVLDVAGRGSVHMCRSMKQLPALADANNILLIGWSGGSRGLAHTGDRLVDYLQGGATPVTPFSQVKLAFDAPWKPGLENEVAFEMGLRSMYSIEALGLQVPHSASPGELPPIRGLTVEAGLYSNASFVPGGESYESNTYWGAQLDESCLSSHGYKSWHCHERAHVLSHHVTAPAFTRMAQRDASGKDKPDANHMHSKALCTLTPTGENCYDWDDEDFRQRTFQQITMFHREFALLAEEGMDAPRRGTFSANTTSHNGFEDEGEFFDIELMRCREDGIRLGSHTLSSTLSRWFRTGRRIGAIEFREGVTQRSRGYVWVSKTRCNRCPRVSAAQDFAADDRLAEWDLSVCTY